MSDVPRWTRLVTCVANSSNRAKSQLTGGRLFGSCERGRNGEKKSSLKRNSLPHNPQILMKLFEVTLDGAQPAIKRGLLEVTISIEEMSERSLNDR